MSTGRWYFAAMEPGEWPDIQPTNPEQRARSIRYATEVRDRSLAAFSTIGASAATVKVCRLDQHALVGIGFDPRLPATFIVVLTTEEFTDKGKVPVFVEGVPVTTEHVDAPVVAVP